MSALQQAGTDGWGTAVALPLPVVPRFVVRIAGLPMGLLARLRFDQTVGVVDELLELEDRLRVEGEQLSKALYDVVGAVDDRGLRGRLVALRRSIYQGRPPRSGVLDRDVWAVISADLVPRITRWQQHIARRDALRARAEATLEAESVDKRRALADAASDDWFQQGLVLASRDLYAELVKWLAAGPQVPPDDQLEASLAKYLSRATAKTSPYSTFTSLAEGRWTPAGPPARCVGGWTRRSAVEPAMRIALRLRRQLASWPEIKPHLPLRINPSLTICVGAPQGGVTESPTKAHQDPSPPQTQEPTSADGTKLRFLACRGGEAVIEIAVTPTLDRVLEAIRATPARSYAQVVAAVAAADPTTCITEVAEYLDRLVDVELLETQLDVPDQSLDHLGALSDVLAGYPGKRVDALRELLERLRAQLARLADGSRAQARFQSMGAALDTLGALYATLGWTKRGFQVPRKDALFEDTVVAGLDFRCALPCWAGVLDDLRLLAGLSGLYDRFLPARLALAAFFVDHYGPGSTVSFLEFCRVLCDEARRPAGWRVGYRVSGADLGAILDQPSLETTAGLDPLDWVKQLRQQVAAHVRGQPVDQAGIRRLDQRMLGELVAGLPTFAQPCDSIAFYGQPMIRDGTPHFVLNNTDAGFRRAYTRLQRLAERTRQRGGQPALRLPTGEGGMVYADLAEIADSNLNLRISPAPYEIAYPGSVSRRPPSEQIRLGDLDVAHDPTTDRLRLVWASRRKQVVPLHLGMMVDRALPWTYRLLIQTSGVSSFYALPRRLGSDVIMDGQGVGRVPRLCLGAVVVQRAAWVVRSGDVPLREKGEPALSYLIRVTRWVREHGIPPRCFVRAANVDGTTTRLGKNRKPCYVDFSNQVFLRVLCQIAAPPDRMLVLQEILPTDDDLLVTDGSAAYAAECVFELGR